MNSTKRRICFLIAILLVIFVFVFFAPTRREGLTAQPTWKKNGWNYIQNTDYPGNNIFINPVTTKLDDCQAQCMNQSTCAGIVWNTTPCNLKTGFSDGNQKGSTQSQTFWVQGRN